MVSSDLKLQNGLIIDSALNIEAVFRQFIPDQNDIAMY